MDSSKKTKVLNIIFTISIFVFTTFTFIALFLPVVKSTEAYNGVVVMEQSRGIFGANGIMQVVTDYIEAITGEGSAEYIDAMIKSLMGWMVVLVMFAVTSIVITVYMIFVIVRGIQVLKGTRAIKDLFASYANIAFSFFAYVMAVYLVFWEKSTVTDGFVTITGTIGLGSGTSMGLVFSLLGATILIASIFLYKNEKPIITKIFSAVIATIGTVLLSFLFIGGINDGLGTQVTVFNIVRDLPSMFKDSSDNPQSLANTIMLFYGSLFSFVLAVVGVGFIKNLVFEALELNEERYKRVNRPYVPESKAMVFAILAFIFAGIGYLVCTIMYCGVFSNATRSYHVGTMPVLAFIFLSILLGLAIANKAISGNRAPKKEAEAKAE